MAHPSVPSTPNRPPTPSPTDPTPPGEQLSYPRHRARTAGFTLGAPRRFTLAPDGSRVVFLRSASGVSRSGALWVVDLPSGLGATTERCVADPQALLGADDETLPEAERARRERTREQAGGIVDYSTDESVRRAAFALSGRLFVADLTGAAEPSVWEVPAAGPVLDPQLDPTGQRVAYVTGGALHVTSAERPTAAVPADDWVLAAPDGPEVTWGLAEFVAAEEMDRVHGYWWAPDGQAILAARVDESPVPVWHLTDPAQPERPATPVHYPAAGTANAHVRLMLLDVAGHQHLAGRTRDLARHQHGAPGQQQSPLGVEVNWDTTSYPYLAVVRWRASGPPLLTVQSRDQRSLVVLAVDPSTGATRVVRTVHDPAWVDLVPGVPAWAPDGRLVHVRADHDVDTHRLYADDQPLTPPGLQVLAVTDLDTQGVTVVATDEPTEDQLWHISWDAPPRRLSPTGGTHTGRRSGSRLLMVSAGLDQPGSVARVFDVDPHTASPLTREVGVITSYAERPRLVPNVRLLQLGRRRLRAALLLPSWHTPGTPLPVLCDPYGGPHARRVMARQSAFTDSQWFAEQGFAVLVADGRGTPARGPAWERVLAGDLATAPLDDQVIALQEAADVVGDLDLTRVGIRGWSFGGFLAALAVLRRPDVFHAAVAGAPVTDWRLYDTHYTERYLGVDPAGAQAASYQASSLLDDAAKLRRPLMLIHGLADDNVVVAHTLRLSSALLAAGRPHTVLPLSGVTHMTPQEVVAENLLMLQASFLRDALGVPDPDTFPAGAAHREETAQQGEAAR